MAADNLQRLTVPTIWATEMGVAQYVGHPLTIHPNSTLDTVRNSAQIFPQIPTVHTLGMEIVDAYEPVADTPNLRYQYVGIGIGAHTVSLATPLNIPTYKILPHRCTDVNLFHWIPFLVRPIDQDLTTQERTQYRYRRTLQIGGNLYAAYYLRKLDLSGVDPATILTTIGPNGSEINQPFIPSEANLYPTPPTNPQTSGGVRLTHSVPLTLILTSDDIDELRNVAQLLYGDTSILMVSEVAFCSGVDKPITGRYPNSGTQNVSTIVNSPVQEAVGLRVSSFFCSLNPLGSAEDLSMELNLGGGEPLYGAEYPVG